MDRASQRLLRRLPLASGRPIAYGVAVGVSVAAVILRFLVDGAMPPGFPFVTLFPAVIFCAFVFGRGPGALSAVLCGLASWYFFIPPFHTFGLGGGVALSLAFYSFVVTIDIALIHWMQRANRWLESERENSRMLAERSDLLFRELQHRVSNNLQVVAALITLQKRDVTDPKARAALDEAARRLALIGRIQRQLHDPSGKRLGMGEFLRQLGADVIEASGCAGIACSVEAEPGLELDGDAAIPVALIVAESVSNAIEHGFAGRDAGRIAIRLHRVGEQVELSIVDDGAGLPSGFDATNSKSLGLRIATALARQLGGTYSLTGGAGTTARLTLPTRATA